MAESITFGAWLKRRRQQLDMTQKGLAFKAGCSVGTIRKMESNERRPSVQLAALLAEHLDIPPDQREPFIAFARADVDAADNSLAGVLSVLNSPAQAADRIFQSGGWPLPQVPFMAPDNEVARLIGREEEYNSALAIISAHKRLVISGMGGVGKTTLAVALAHELRGRFPDGVYWADMVTSSPDAVLENWCQAAGVDLSHKADFQSRAAHMRGVFSQKEALIILDDVVDSQQARQIIPSHFSPSAVIVTTRSADVAQNITLRETQQVLALAPMRRSASMELFRDIMGAELDQEQREAADKVAELLGDLPLALQIAAAICVDSAITLDNMAFLFRNLEDRLEPLRREQKPVVRLAFEQSWEFLGPSMRAALQTVAVFKGHSFTTAAFAVVSGLDPVPAALLLTRLTRLFLLNRGQHGRYQQHSLVAAYALEKLAEQDEPWIRFAHYYHAALAQSVSPKETFLQDAGNIMSAMQTSHRLAAWPLLLQFNDLLQPIWRAQGFYSLSREGSRWALDAAEAVGDQKAQAETHYHWGVASLEQSSYDEAQERLQKALSLLERLGDHNRVGDAYYHLSRNALAQDDFSKAEADVQLAWQAYQQSDNLRGMGRAFYRRAHIIYNQGEYQRALDLVDEAITAHKAAGDSKGWFQSAMLGTSASLQLKKVEAASAYCQTAETLAGQIDDQVETAVFYFTYADLCRFQGEFGTAYEYAHKALETFSAMQDIYSQANTLNLLAGNEVFWNDAQPQRQLFAAGLEYCQQGLVLCDLIEYSLGRGMILLLQGRLLAQQGQQAEACAAWRLSQEEAVKLNHQWLQTRLQQLITEHKCAPRPQ